MIPQPLPLSSPRDDDRPVPTNRTYDVVVVGGRVAGARSRLSCSPAEVCAWQLWIAQRFRAQPAGWGRGGRRGRATLARRPRGGGPGHRAARRKPRAVLPMCGTSVPPRAGVRTARSSPSWATLRRLAATAPRTVGPLRGEPPGRPAIGEAAGSDTWMETFDRRRDDKLLDAFHATVREEPICLPPSTDVAPLANSSATA